MDDNFASYRPRWVPVHGHHLHRTGVHFDAVRIQGVRGEAAVEALTEAVGSAEVGPVVCDAIGFRWMYFVLPPRSSEELRWPREAQRFGRDRTVAYVGIPALFGNTWPLRWLSRPTPRTPFVGPRLLSEVTCNLPDTVTMPTRGTTYND